MGVRDEDGERQLSEPPATREELIDLPTQAFKALAQSSGNLLGTVALGVHAEGRLKHPIQTRMQLEERSRMRSTWQCGNDTFFITMQALAAAKLQSQCLNLFHGFDMNLFALASDQLNIIAWDIHAFRQRDEEEGETYWLYRVTEWTADQVRAEAEKESNFNGLAGLVRKCPQLQDFAHQALGIPLPGIYGLRGFDFPSWKILQHVEQLPSLPKLNRLTLRFQTTNESIPLNLLKRTRPGGYS
ncbi:f-box domain protein [Fusarium beomiforme]|uniref:F-box domain protein n=1 Tax=Fusarium beomiforme TaxID=44412 RepID=A0A9P5DWS4_9HYPO|nr:f-box domain protein [Fusarium beomiforme]